MALMTRSRAGGGAHANALAHCHHVDMWLLARTALPVEVGGSDATPCSGPFDAKVPMESLMSKEVAAPLGKAPETSNDVRTEDARRVVEEYAAELRQMLNNLRRRFN